MINTRDVTRYKGHKVPKDPDCTFILCYAVIQLNVDQHNPRVKKPMTFAEFKNNQRTLNAGERIVCASWSGDVHSTLHFMSASASWLSICTSCNTNEKTFTWGVACVVKR